MELLMVVAAMVIMPTMLVLIALRGKCQHAFSA
jgi:hypothetical protein